MTASQQFSLRWNNYSQHIVTALEDLRSDDELTDVTLSCDGERIKAHKILLSACSTYFRDTFRDNPCKHPVIILKGVNFADLQSVVTFMYNGQVNVSQERLQTFLQTAELLQIKGLTDVNEKEDNAKKRSHGGNSGPLSSQSQPSNQDSNSRSATPDNPQRPPTPKRKRMTVGGFNEGASSSAGSASFNSSTIPIQPIVIGTSGSNGSVAGPSSSGGGLLNPQSVVIPSTSSSSQAAQPLEEEGFHDVSVVKYEDEDIVEDEDYDEKHMSSEDNDNSAQDMLCNVESGSLGVFSGGVRTRISASGVDSSTHGDLGPLDPGTEADDTFDLGLNLNFFDESDTRMETSNVGDIDLDSQQTENWDQSSQLYKCQICGRSYRNLASFKDHKRFHLGYFHCKVCGKQLSKKSHVTRHIRTVHPEQAV